MYFFFSDLLWVTGLWDLEWEYVVLCFFKTYVIIVMMLTGSGVERNYVKVVVALFL